MSALGSFYFILMQRTMQRISLNETYCVNIVFITVLQKTQTFLYNIFVNKIGVKWKKKRLDNEF